MLAERQMKTECPDHEGKTWGFWDDINYSAYGSDSSTGPDQWAEVTDPDDPDYLRGTAMYGD